VGVTRRVLRARRRACVRSSSRATRLLSGYRLGAAWRVAAALLVSLAIGMLFAGKYDVASDNYVYVLLSLVGFSVRRFDRWTLGATAASEARPGRALSTGGSVPAR
jgi:hypothetical protein